jgi:hypothetical protein
VEFFQNNNKDYIKILNSQMMRQLILWNKTKYGETLGSAFGRENVITNSVDFIAITKQLEKFNSLIVLCELEWLVNGASAYLQQLQGIELVKELRRTYNLSIPVLFVSFHSLENIFNAESEILTAIGHNFYQLPGTPQDFKSFIIKEFGDINATHRLSVMELNDIKSFYCSKEGILSHELHNLNHFLDFNITQENHDSTYDELQNSIRKIHDLFLTDSTIALVSFQVAFPALGKENISEAVNHIVRLGNNLMKNYGGASIDSATLEKSVEQYRWQVLFLDDQINDQHELVRLMNANSMNVICVDNAQKALQILQKDWQAENRIMVVIADYRLYENTAGVKRHQKIQGYQFLKDLASTDHLVRLVAFSGLQRKFLLNSFRHYNIRTEVKSKTDYLSSEQTRQIFCEEIKELAEENLEAIEALPLKCAGFDKYLKDAYKEFRMHPDYNKMEGNTSLTAKEYVWEIQQQINDGLEIKIGAIDNIKSPLAKTKKDIEAFFKRFQNYLVARRIALWLYAANKKGLPVTIDSRRIAEILTDQEYSTDAYRQILSTNLGLSLDDFPKNITIEERRWLQYEMQMNIFRDITLITPVFNQIAKIYKDFIVSDDSLKEAIRKANYLLIYKYKQANYHVDFTKDFSPQIKTATDIRVLFLLITQHIKKDKNKIEVTKPFVSRIRLALFESRSIVIYLKNVFQYFNVMYGILNKEQSNLINAPAKIKDKKEFADKSNVGLKKCFERVHELLLNIQFPNDTDATDTWLLFYCGEKVVVKNGRKILEDKAKFFSELTKCINDENKSLSETFGGDRPIGDNFSGGDAFNDFPAEEELN